MRLEIEPPDIHSQSGCTVAIVVGIAIGSVFCLTQSVCVGILVFFAVAGWVMIITDWMSIRTLPEDAWRCAEAARHRFQQEYPDADVESIAIRDTGEDRFIVSVRYKKPLWFSIPTARVYFAVKRSDQTVSSEPTGLWWPRGLK